MMSPSYLFALGATSSELVFIASGAENFLVFRYKTFCADWSFAESTAEALVVPLLSLVLHFLHT